MSDVVNCKESFIYSHVINFLQYCIEKGVNESTIAKYASEIFGFADVKDAQKDFWGVCRVKNQSGEEVRRRCRGTLAHD